jgi:hypothetical protein
VRSVLASLALITALGLGSAASAADPPKPAAQAGATAGSARIGHGAKDRGAMEMGPMRCMSLSGGRLAAIRADLKITNAQSPQWDAFADAMKSNARVMRPGVGMIRGDVHGAQPGPGMRMGDSLPERLERHETMMTDHLEALHKVRAAVSSLYDVLTSDQRAKADRLLCGDISRHGPGAAKGRQAHPNPSQ